MLLFLHCLLAFGDLAEILFASPQVDKGFIGASSITMGLMTYFFLTYRNSRFGVFFFGAWLKVSATLLLTLVIALQIYGVMHSESSNIAFISHIGGMFGGALMRKMFRPNLLSASSRIRNI